MSIFNESYTNILIEAVSSSNPFRFAGSNIDIDDDDKCLGDKKLISAVNKAWPRIKKEINSFVDSLISEWYYEKGKDGKETYRYGANTAEKVMKFATLDAISLYKVSKHYTVLIWFNNRHDTKDAEKFFEGHSMRVAVEISTDDYKVTDIECSL